jgi:hypothetical protein
MRERVIEREREREREREGVWGLRYDHLTDIATLFVPNTSFNKIIS